MSVESITVRHYNLDRSSEPANGIFGAGAHSDYGLITLLATDDSYGLQVCTTKYIYLVCSNFSQLIL